MKLESKSHRRMNRRAVVLLGAIISCLVASTLSSIYHLGGFTPWRSLPKPPFNPIHIVEADQDNIWLEADDRKIYSLSLFCRNGDCFHWGLIDPEKGITPFQYGESIRGGDCKSLRNTLFPGDPRSKQVLECILSPSVGEWGHDTYFALLPGGNAMYWTHRSGRFNPVVLILISTVTVPLATTLLISAIYWGKRRKK